MRHQWIVDTLADLREFALMNGMGDLAADLALAQRSARRNQNGPSTAAKTPPPTGPGAAGQLGSAHERARPDILT